MASKDRFSYETQGAVSIALALLAGVAAIGAFGLLWRNYRVEAGATLYGGSSSMWFLFLAAALGSGLLFSGVGFILALNSAGQKRNTQSGRAWIGFFLSAASFALTAVAGLFFYLTKQAM